MGRSAAASLRVAAAQPVTVTGDLAGNVAAHASAIRDAGARLVVFPELSLTGYELDAAPVDVLDPLLDPLRAACARAGAVALAGAPVRQGAVEHIAMLRVDAGGITVVHRKVWLHGEESSRFAAGPGPSRTTVDGWRVGLAICSDTNAREHAAALARAGVDLYVAGVLDVPGEKPGRAERSVATARALGVPVVVAGYASPTSRYPTTAGRSTIHGADGVALAEASDAPGQVVSALLPGTGRGPADAAMVSAR